MLILLSTGVSEVAQSKPHRTPENQISVIAPPTYARVVCEAVMLTCHRAFTQNCNKTQIDHFPKHDADFHLARRVLFVILSESSTAFALCIACAAHTFDAGNADLTCFCAQDCDAELLTCSAETACRALDSLDCALAT